MMRHNKLTEEEIEKIKELHSQGKLNMEIAKEIGVCPATICDRLKSLGLKANQKEIFSPSEREIIFSRYKAGETIKEIALDFSQTSDQINWLLRKEGLTRRKGKRVHFDESYFENVDDEYKAYFLGLLFADGNIHRYTGNQEGRRRKGWITQINLNQKEGEEILIELKKRMGDERPLKIYSRLGTAGKYIRHAVSVAFGSEKLYNDLTKWGMTENKLEQPRRLPHLPSDLIHHFIRGYFDGDGSVFYSDGKYKHIGANICGNKIFLEELNQIFNSIIKTPRTSQRHVFDRGRFGSIHFGTTETCRQLYDYLYKDAHIFMKIKHDKFIEYLSRR